MTKETMMAEGSPASVVYNMATGAYLHFSLPPREAVVAAWEQARGNWSTWTYGTSKAPVEEGQHFFFFAGDLAVRKG